MLTQKTSERRKLLGPFLNRDICFIHFIGKRKRIAQNVIIAMPNFIITWSNDAASNITHLMSLPNELSFSNNSNISRKMYYQAILFYVNVAYVAFSQIAFILIPIIDLLFSIVLLWLFAVWEK